VIQLQKKDYFDVTGGMNSQDSLVNYADNEFFLLENMIRSRESTLKTRKGRQRYAKPVSTSAIKEFDRYVTEAKSELVMSTDGRYYRSNNTCGVVTALKLEAQLTNISSYDPVTHTADLTLNAGHHFLVDDEVYVTIGGSSYVWLVTNVSGTTVTVQGIVLPGAMTFPYTCYGGRTSNLLVVEDAINFRTDDMIILQGYKRHFRILSITLNSGEDYLTLDESISWVDSSTSPLVLVSERWEQFSYCDRELNSNVLATSINVSTDKINIPITTSLANGWGIWLVDTGTGLPYPLLESIKYFIVGYNSGTGDFQISETEGGAPVDIVSLPLVPLVFTDMQVESAYDIPVSLIADATITEPDVCSTMLRGSLFMVDGENEPLVYDGTEISRMGFHEVPDTITCEDFSSMEFSQVDLVTGSVTPGAHKYLITYARYDNNNELVESGITQYRYGTVCVIAKNTTAGAGTFTIGETVTSGTVTGTLFRIVGTTYYLTNVSGLFSAGDTITGDSSSATRVLSAAAGDTTINGNIVIPVPVIAYKKNNELLYNVDKCKVVVYKTETDGTNFYRALEVPMNTLGNFQIKSITKSGSDQIIELLGSPDISKLIADAVLGDYILVKGLKTVANNGIFRMTAKDNTLKTITVVNASVANQVALAGNSSLGYVDVCIRDNIADAELILNDVLYCNKNIVPETQAPVIAQQLTVWDNRCMMAIGKSYQEAYISMDFPYSSILVKDTFTINCGSTIEVYEFALANETTVAGATRIDLTNVTDMTTLLRAMCEAINSKIDGKCYAYYERVNGAGAFVLRERQRNIGILKIKFNFSASTPPHTADVVKIRINAEYFTANNSYKDFYISSFGSRIWFSKAGEGQAFVGTFGNVATESIFWNDVYPDNGEMIVGINPQPYMLIILKEGSCYKMAAAGTDAYSVELIDNNVGCVAPKSITCISEQVLFLSKFGLVGTDGFKINWVGNKLKREWKNMNFAAVYKACCTNIAKVNQYWISVPYNINGVVATENNVTFVLDYEKNAWYKLINTPISTYVKLDESYYTGILGDTQYMSSSNGITYTMRELDEASDYRDDNIPIESTIITKWYDGDDKTARKMFDNLILNVYTTDADSNIALSYAYDFDDGFELMANIQGAKGLYGHFSWGHAVYGGAPVFNSIKQPLSPEKCFVARFKMYSNELDKCLEIQGLSLEYKMLNTKALAQTDNL